MSSCRMVKKEVAAASWISAPAPFNTSWLTQVGQVSCMNPFFKSCEYSVVSRERTYPNFWYNSTKGLRWVLTDQSWQVADDTGSLDLLTHAEDKEAKMWTENTWSWSQLIWTFTGSDPVYFLHAEKLWTLWSTSSNPVCESVQWTSSDLLGPKWRLAPEFN